MKSVRIAESGVVVEAGFTTTTLVHEHFPSRASNTAVEVLHEGNGYLASVRE